MVASPAAFGNSIGRRESAGPGERGRGTRHRLVVLAIDELDVVQAAGGLLYDQSMMCWDITVHLIECRDDRPLRILGVGSQPFGGDGGYSLEHSWPDVIMFSAELCRTHARLQSHFAQASRRTSTEVALWGGDWPPSLQEGIGRVDHQLTSAARAFKAQALWAVGLPRSTVDEHEKFLWGKRRIGITASLSAATQPNNAV